MGTRRRPIGPGRVAFSLTEVVIALGIATISVVSILALFPVGLDTARESSAETQAAVLARTIVSDLVSGSRARGFSNAILLKGNNNASAGDYQSVNLTLANTQSVAYRYEGHWFGVQGYEPLALKAMGLVSNPSNSVSGADFVATVAVQPVTGLTESLAQVDVQISAPATVVLSNRTLRTTFSFLVGP